jgi:hypothetical protein
MHEGDTFEVGNGGEGKLLVRIAGFVAEAETPAENEADAENEVDVAVEGVDVNWQAVWDDGESPIKIPETISQTTVYLFYGGYIEHGLSDDTIGGYYVAFAGMAKAEDDPTEHYYIRAAYPKSSSEYVEKTDLSEHDGDVRNVGSYVVSLYGNQGDLATQILVSTDGTDEGIVETINISDATPTLEELKDGKLPEGYGEPVVSDSRTEYLADGYITVEENGDTDDVTVRKDVILTYEEAETDEFVK